MDDRWDRWIGISLIVGWPFIGFAVALLFLWLESIDQGYWSSYVDDDYWWGMGLAWPLALMFLPIFVLCIWIRKTRERWTKKLRSTSWTRS